MFRRCLQGDTVVPWHVSAAVSDPGGEGRQLFTELSACAAVKGGGSTVAVLDDAALCDHVRRGACDIVLVGADAVLSSGDVVNKVGTRALAEAAAAANVPVHVVCDEWKRWQHKYPPPMEAIFELVPARLITSVVGMDDAMKT